MRRQRKKIILRSHAHLRIQYLRLSGTEWTPLLRTPKLSGMPLPASTISTLGDHFGQYLISVRCLDCSHYGELQPEGIAAKSRRGWRTPFASVLKALRCAACKSRRCQVEIGFKSRPRGWVKNPS